MSKILTKEEKEDYRKFFVEKGEPGFSPERNKAIVEKTIKKMDMMRLKKRKEFAEGVRERADAVDTYLRSRIAQGSTPIEKYFGKKWLAHLRGQKILRVLKTKYNVNTGQTEPVLYLPQ